MARIIPSDLSTLALAGAHAAEIRTLAYLKRALPEDYTVFHGVHWTRDYSGHTVYGEIDFAILNRAGDVLVIEQKNGALEETAEGLVKVYGDQPKNVGTQVHRSLDNLRDKFRHLNKSGRRGLRLNYLIYCPDHRLAAVHAAGLDSERVVDAAGRDRLAERIQSLMPPAAADDPDWTALVERFLSQGFEVAPDVHSHIEAGERSFTRLSGGLARTIADIDMHPMRLRVRGTAGCGKSIVAREAYVRAVDAGYRPLLVCFNRLLAERLKGLVGADHGGGLITTFHGLCSAFLAARGQPLDFARVRSDPEFWPRAQRQVLDMDIPDDWRFDTLVLDEGQDFAPEWAAIVARFLVGDADVLWLEDRDQDLYGTQAVDLPGFVTFNARRNHRSPESIARFIERVLPFRFECANDLPGLGVGIARYDDPARQHHLAAEAVERLIAQGFPPQAITVLTAASRARSAFDGVDAVGGLKVRRFANAYDSGGNQVMTDGELAFESVNRFKGQQSPAVIVTDVDPGHDDGGVPQPRDLRRLFCAMTRATVRLEILARDGNPATRGWEEDGRGD